MNSIASIVVILLVFLDLRDPVWSLLAMLPTILGLAATLGAMRLFGIPFNPLNVMALPVILGKEASLRLNQALMIAFYPIVALLVLMGSLGWGVLLVLAALPRLIRVLKIYNEPKPAGPPLIPRKVRPSRVNSPAITAPGFPGPSSL